MFNQLFYKKIVNKEWGEIIQREGDGMSQTIQKMANINCNVSKTKNSYNSH